MVAGALAQGTPSNSIYTRIGGVHKIAQVVDTWVTSGKNDSVLMANKNFSATYGSFPVPAIDFLLTSYICSKTGGPQVFGSAYDTLGVVKWFAFTPDQSVRQMDLLVGALKKAGCDAQSSTDFLNWFMDAAQKATPVEPGPELVGSTTLYGRLGGFVPISVVVDDFVNHLAADKTIGSNPNTVKSLTDGHVTIPGLKYLVTEQLCEAAGGPWKYSGKPMVEAHKGLNISDKEWLAGTKILIGSLNKYHVPAKEQGQILAVVASTKGDIVGK
jgi:hemoglobin